MNCQEIQTQLSDYLDQSLDTIRSKSIENHLLSCVTCRAEAESLADCIGQIRDLPMIEPPPGFAHRVMAHARNIEIQLPFWQRIFSNVKFTLPVQASAVVLIAVFAVLLYQRETGLQKNDRALVTAPLPKLPALTKEAAAPVTDATTSSSITSSNPAPAKPQVSEFHRRALTQANSKQPSALPPLKEGAQTAPQSVAAATPEKAMGDAGEAPRRAPIQAQEVATGLEPLRPSAEGFGMGVAGNWDPPLFRAPFGAERALSPLSEPISDVEFVVRRRPPVQREQKTDALNNAMRERTATESPLPAAKSAPLQNSSVVEVRWFSVPAERYEQFKKDLAAEATIESERTPGSAEKQFAVKSARDLLIKVMILSPAER
ncbi:MAG: anti-sigma factor family protein [Chloroflexota bacterium]